jgi:PAS domain S-box-containing protein
VLRDKSGGIAGTLSSGQDVTERKRAEETLRWELRVNWALSELYAPLTTKGSDIVDMTAAILDTVKSLTGSPHGYVAIIEPETGDVVSLTLTEMLKGQCHVAGEARRVRFPRGADGRYPGLWGHPLNTKRPFFTNAPAGHETSTGLPRGHIPLTRFLSVPVMLGEELVGQIALANAPEDYRERDLQAIARIGRYFALAIQRMRTDEALRQARDDLELRVTERTVELLKVKESLEREILERKGIEKALREGNELLDKIFSNTHLAIAYMDKDFNFIRVNRAYAAYDEKDPDFYEGKNHFQLFPNAENEKIFQQVRDTGIPFTVAAKSFEYGDHPERGTTYWDWSLIPVKDEQDHVEGFVLGLVNVTERIISEALVRESEKKYSTLVENALVGIYIAQEGKILFANRQYAAMHGYTPEEMVGMESWKLVHPEDRSFFRKLVQDRKLGKDAPSEYELRGITKDGRTITTLRKVSSVDFLDVTASLVNVMDITRLKETEHLLRTQDKMASLGRIAAGIAHELRNPLSGINIHLTNLERLMERLDIPDSEAAEHLKVIVENLKRASGKIEAVVRRVMDFSKPSSHRLAPSDINRILKGALDLCAVSLRKTGISVQLDLAGDLPRCPANENLMEEVFVNLISNAVQAMENIDGPKKLFISTCHSEGAIHVRIEDSGPGIPEADREKIFEPFHTGRVDGIGIGLSICYRIVKDHGGFLTVGTSRWGGALFETVLPVGERGKF